MQITPSILVALSLFIAYILLGRIAAVCPAQGWIRVCHRWARLAFFSLATTLILKKYFLPDVGKLPLASAAVLGYILVETFLYWLEICAAGVSGISPFGKYTPTQSAWSCEPSMLKLKRKIEREGFKKTAAFTLDFGSDVKGRTTIFDSADKKMRLDITFIPLGNSCIISPTIYSVDSEGVRWVSDGNPTPFGLSYPKEWKLARKPTACNPIRLIKIHKKRLGESSFVEITESPEEYLNTSIHRTKEQNVSDGFLNTGAGVATDGLFTPEGKMHIWLDMIKTNYFPFI